MKNLYRILIFPTLIFSFVSIQGCVSVSYSGKSYTSTEKVEILKPQDTAPAGYEIMGKAVASGPDQDSSRADLQKKIMNKAKSEGADAVMIVLYENVIIGKEREDEFLNSGPTNSAWGMNVNTQGDTDQLNIQRINLGKADSNQTPIFKHVMKAVFLKKTDK
ncbi:MAG TPA: hypothetical protein DCZ94_00350 [Lentisphaeria bacterium]|nr:MAG: hypothetical protein A2X48_18845 [Lentisphaerae bacterium GWF2_49_21]HBC85381.1 hypothetical protein [Lentisphaeria bacterium]